MKNRAINKNERKTYFDLLARKVQGQEIEIDVAGLDVGDQVEQNWTLLEGISYDPKEDILFIHTADFEHQIIKPEEIVSAQNDLSITAVYVKDPDGHVQSLKFRPLLMIEAPDVQTRI